MISFDTFSGPRRLREAELDPAGLLCLAEQPTLAPQLFPPPPDPLDESSDEVEPYYESQEDEADCNLFHEHDVATDAPEGTSDVQQEQNSGGRIRQLVELLTLQNRNVGDARSALVDKLLGVVKVHDLLLSRASEDQIANAANDAITDEILASVDQEDKRRTSLQLVQAAPNTTTSSRFGPGQLSPFRVLELVDVLDSTTGGMVKRVLTKVRRRAPLNARMVRDNELEKDVEFCRFCSAYSDHTAEQHRCRICGMAGHHRSRSCPNRGVEVAPSTLTSSLTVSTADDGHRYCTLCNAWGQHATEKHRCRTCGTHGMHRSQRCPVASSSSLVPWIGSPANSRQDREYCSHCHAWRPHASEQHRCRVCGAVGDHGSGKCPNRDRGLSPSSGTSRYAHYADDTSPAMSPERAECSFCRKKAAHSSSEHLCRVCRAVGEHRSDDCPMRSSSSSSTVLSYSVDAASKVRDRVLEKIPQVLPSPAAALVWRSLDKVGDADLILRKTLQRIGVWGGGSQTPITTPYAPPSTGPIDRSSDGTTEHQEVVSPAHSSSSSANNSSAVVLDGGRASGVYVLSYAEGHSVVPARILKYMRLLMHHEVSTNAFAVVVRFDPRPSHWELQRPGMVSPRSLPTSPTLCRQVRKRMDHYTLQTLRGARDKLRQLVIARRKNDQRLRQQEQRQAHARALQNKSNTTSKHQKEAQQIVDEEEERRAVVAH